MRVSCTVGEATSLPLAPAHGVDAGSAAAVESSTFSIYQQLAVYRFILGFGVGGPSRCV